MNSRRSGVHQSSHATDFDRYPEIFGAVEDLLSQEDKRLLSFGCSTGEEMVTLSHWFPGAHIVGADISPPALRAAQRRCRGLPNVTIVNSARVDLADFAPYNVIFALSVLCRHPDTKNLTDSSDVYPFQVFERTCEELAEMLTEDGLLVIYNANYRFTDTRTAQGFAAVELDSISESGFVVKFDSKGQRLDQQNYPYCIFHKVAS